MASLADRGVSPSVVDDQRGRLTFADDLARATVHLIASGAAYGTYNVSSGGTGQTWADIAREVFRLRGRDPEDVTGVSTEDYFADKPGAPRPRHSMLDLAKLEATGFKPADGFRALKAYVAELPAQG